VGGRSRVAAQLLSGMGFRDVYNVAGGIRAWNGAKAEGPVEFHLEFLTQGDTPARILPLSFNMEKALEDFYLAVKEQTGDQDLSATVTKLAEIEHKHQERIMSLGETLGVERDDFDDAEEGRDRRMEGGIDVEEFLAANKEFLNDVEGILNVAMIIETQALDLYLRIARDVKNDLTANALYALANEEKQHLALLGDLLDVKLEEKSAT